MDSRREFISYIGVGAVGAVIGYYVGAQRPLRNQSSEPAEGESEEPDTSDNSDTPDEEEFVDDFENGTLDGWSIIQSPSSTDWSENNNWSTTTDSISGEYSLYIDSNGDASANIIATDERVVDLSRDFTFSYEWRTSDPSNRGPHIRLFDADGTDFQDEGISEYQPVDGIGIFYGGDAIDPEGSPYSDNPIMFGTSEIPPRPLRANTDHITRVEKRGEEATLFIDEEEMGTTTVTDTGDYRLALLTAGTWGSPSSMTWDTIRVVYQ